MTLPPGLEGLGPPRHSCPFCSHDNRASARYCGSCGKSLLGVEPPLAPIGPGVVLAGRYRIGRRLGRGGFGAAYLAYDLSLQSRRCVVKQPRFGEYELPEVRKLILDNFASEAHLLIKLNHPGHSNIPEIYAYLEDEHCLVMKYIEGPTLSQVLEERGAALSELEALQYARAVCAALVYMHGRAQPVLHRDLKPANILRDAEGRVWVIDFGLARDLYLAADGASHGMGTLGYTPQEQFLGAAEPRSDIYALGATLYNLLANRQPPVPVGGEAPSLRDVLPGARRAVDLLVRACMAPRAADRPDALSLLGELDAIIAGLHLPLPPQPQPPPAPLSSVGRSAELASLDERLGRDHVVLIAGMAGVGKTTVAALLAARAGSAPVFWHRCRPGEGAAVVVRYLVEWLAHHGHEAAWQSYAQARQEHGLGVDLLQVFDRAALSLRQLPAVVCLDDLHLLADDPLAEGVVERLVELAAEGPLRLVATARAALPFIADAYTLALGGLAPADARALLAQLGAALPEPLVAQLYGATAGNPQFLTLAANALAGAPDPAALVGSLLDRTDIEVYLNRQIDQGLIPQERAVMGAVAALLGDPAPIPLVEELLDGAPARAILRALAERHLLLPERTLAGRAYGQHAIVRDFFYANLGPRRRGELHGRAAAWYMREDPEALRGAQHLALAGEPRRAVALVTPQVRRHLSLGRARELDALLGQLAAAAGQTSGSVADEARHLLSPGEQLDLRIARGAVAAQLRQADAARAFYEEAAALAAAIPDLAVRRGREVQIAYGLGELLELEAPREAIVWLERGLATLGTADDPTEEARLRLRLASAQIAAGDEPLARDELSRCLALLPDDATALRAFALNSLGIIACNAGDYAAGRACFDQSLALYEQLGVQWETVGLLQNIALTLDVGGAWGDAVATYRRAQERARELGHVAREADLENNLAYLLMNLGDWEAAEAALGHSLALCGRFRLRETELYARSTLAELRLRQERWDEAAAALNEAHAIAAELNTQAHSSEIYRGLALVDLAAGDHAAALAHVQRAVELAADNRLAEGTARRVLGQVLLASGEGQEAVTQLEASLALLEDDPFERARTQTVLGRALLAAEPARAADLLAEAEATVGRLGGLGPREQ